MVDTLQIENFKSVKDLTLDCGRINLFLGQPNTGKSNILEALGLLSSLNHGKISDFVRFGNLTDLFNQFNIYQNIILELDEHRIEVSHERNEIHVNYDDGHNNEYNIAQMDMTGSRYHSSGNQQWDDLLKRIRYYQFEVVNKFITDKFDYLNPPHGDNLSSIIQTNPELREAVSGLFNSFGYKIVIEEPTKDIKLLADTTGIMTLIPYRLLSDTLQRMAFYLAIIHSNKESILVLNEPESNTFPYYTKNMAEMIALDDRENQYFISTHNPYFLLSMIEKTKLAELHVFVTYMEDYETKAKKLTRKQLEDILDHSIDPFFNVDRYIKE